MLRSTSLSALSVALIGLTSGLSSTQAQAEIGTFNVSLTATGIGDVPSIFGINSLPSRPFTGSLSFDQAQLGPSASFTIVKLTGFQLTIGDTSWFLGDIHNAKLSTDSLGAMDWNHFQLSASNSAGALFIQVGVATNLSWDAIDMRLGDTCWFDADPSGGYTGPTSGPCIGGGPFAVHVSNAAAVPEPASYALLGLGLAGLLAARRRASP